MSPRGSARAARSSAQIRRPARRRRWPADRSRPRSWPRRHRRRRLLISCGCSAMGRRRIRRRAALAIRRWFSGRRGALSEVPRRSGSGSAADGGVRPRPESGDASARDPLIAALRDPSPLVQGSAAEALGRTAIEPRRMRSARWPRRSFQSGAVAQTPGADGDAMRDSPVGALRLAMFALVRLNAYDQLAAAVLDGAQPRVRWWPVAFALQRLEDPPCPARAVDAPGGTPIRIPGPLPSRASA